MGMSVKELLQKAVMTTADFDTPTTAPLTIEQVDEFLKLAITPQIMLSEVRIVKSKAAKWQESKIDFASRILYPGLEAERLVFEKRTKATTGRIEMSTVLVKGEVPISDEVMEDNVERAGFGDTIVSMIAEGSGRDLEELFIQADTDDSIINHGEGAGDYLRMFDGWLKQAMTGVGANTYDAVADAKDYQAIFAYLIKSLPARYKRDLANMRFWVPTTLEETYREQLAARMTGLGDALLEGDRPVKYQSVKIVGVPLFPIISGTPDTSWVFLTHRLNCYAGIRREIKLETFRDPREGATSFIVTSRVDAKLAHVPATAVAYNVNVEP